MTKPNRKVQAGGLAGLLATVIVWALGLADVAVPPDVAAALATLMISLVAYFVPEPVKVTP